jgi:hypothetical protein
VTPQAEMDKSYKMLKEGDAGFEFDKQVSGTSL